MKKETTPKDDQNEGGDSSTQAIFLLVGIGLAVLVLLLKFMGIV